MAGFLADVIKDPPTKTHSALFETSNLGHQAKLDSTFAALGKAFTKKIPDEVSDVLRTFGIEPENMLALAAGARGLGRLMGKGELSSGSGESRGLGAVYTEASHDPLHGLHNRLPMYSIRAVSDYIGAWEIGEGRLDLAALRTTEKDMRSALADLVNDADLTAQQRLVVNDLDYAATLCNILARLCEAGNVANNPYFRQAFAAMPVLNFLPQWHDFMEARFPEGYSASGVSSSASSPAAATSAAAPEPA